MQVHGIPVESSPILNGRAACDKLTEQEIKEKYTYAVDSAIVSVVAAYDICLSTMNVNMSLDKETCARLISDIHRI